MTAPPQLLKGAQAEVPVCAQEEPPDMLRAQLLDLILPDLHRLIRRLHRSPCILDNQIDFLVNLV
jgi:hypothetical protein